MEEVGAIVAVRLRSSEALREADSVCDDDDDGNVESDTVALVEALSLAVSEEDKLTVSDAGALPLGVSETSAEREREGMNVVDGERLSLTVGTHVLDLVRERLRSSLCDPELVSERESVADPDVERVLVRRFVSETDPLLAAVREAVTLSAWDIDADPVKDML